MGRSRGCRTPPSPWEPGEEQHSSEHPHLCGPRETVQAFLCVLFFYVEVFFSGTKVVFTYLSIGKHLEEKFRVLANVSVCSKQVLQQFSCSLSVTGSWSNKL